jgi:hypothetical protein
VQSRRESVERVVALVTAFVTGDPQGPQIYEEALMRDPAGTLLVMTNLSAGLTRTCAELFGTTPERYLQRLAPKLLADADMEE